MSDSDSFVIDVIHEISPDAQDWEISREFSLLQVSDELLYRPFSTLSKGEQTKAMLAALFLIDKGYVGHKSAKMMKRSKTIENRQQSLIEEKSKLLKNVETAEDVRTSTNS